MVAAAVWIKVVTPKLMRAIVLNWFSHILPPTLSCRGQWPTPNPVQSTRLAAVNAILYGCKMRETSCPTGALLMWWGCKNEEAAVGSVPSPLCTSIALKMFSYCFIPKRDPLGGHLPTAYYIHTVAKCLGTFSAYRLHQSDELLFSDMIEYVWDKHLNFN